MIPFIYPEKFENYELLDSGDGKKLERFGNRSLIRPEPQAIWKPRWPLSKWNQIADGEFLQEGSHKGQWKMKAQMIDHWFLTYQLENVRLKFKLNQTAFKHVGVFPEQAANWEYIYKQCKSRNNPKVLNLFAYTGGASLAAKAGGADVIHLDSVKQVISWANENQKHSKLNGIRWVVEDAMKFVQREVKRGNMYQGIMLDPPAYGIGAKGERWKLEEKLFEMLDLVSKILEPGGFLVLNVYSLGMSAYTIQNLMEDCFKGRDFDLYELGLQSESKQTLSLGIVARI